MDFVQSQLVVTIAKVPSKRRYRALVCGLALLGAHLPIAAAPDSDSIPAILSSARQIVPRIVRVQARAADGRINIGSGVPIAPDLVVTNCHVVRRADVVEVAANSADGPRLHRALAQISSTVQDICILRLAQRLGLPPVKLGDAPLVGDPVVAIGFTGGAMVRAHFGEVLKRHPLDGADVLETSTAFDQGASGGGLFGRNGELLGLITFRSQDRQPRYFVTPVQWVVELLENQSFEPIAPLGGRAFWQESGALLPDFLRLPLLSPKAQVDAKFISLPVFQTAR
jgi:serine protease Do